MIRHYGYVKPKYLLVAIIALVLLGGGCSAEDDIPVVSGEPSTSSGSESSGSTGSEAATTADSDEPNTADTTDPADAGGADRVDAAGPKPDRDYEPSNEQLDTLSADCQGDNDMACDILFAITTSDSDTEPIVRECGASGDEPGDSDAVFFCTAGIEVAGDSYWIDESSSALPGIVSACQDGDMTACDFLYFRSEPGSESEQIGNTCADRVAVAIPDCRTMFADK